MVLSSHYAIAYYNISPYTWCGGNPVKFVDPNGSEYGDTLASQDAAAIDFAECYNGNSITENAEYVANINTFTGPNGIIYYSYTKPHKGECDKGASPLSPPNGETITARTHTHAAYVFTYNNNSFSGETNSQEGNRHSSGGDLNVYNLECVDGYVATPNGSLKKYDYSSGRISTISTQIPSDPLDPTRQNMIGPYGSFLKIFNYNRHK